MSRARSRPNGPPPLRDATSPRGLPNLSPAGASKAIRGNSLARFSCGLFSLCRTLRIPVVLENPSTSWLWSLPRARALARLFKSAI
eukprot:9479869-Pyramimonas_sp.AAC.1